MIQRYLTSVIPLLMVQAIGIAQDEVCSVPLDVAASVAKIEGRLGEGKNELDLTPLIEANFGIAVPLMDEGFVVDGIASPREYAQSNACSISFADNQNPGKPLPAQSELITEGGTDDDLSLRLHMGYTEEALYLSYIVTDDFLDLGGAANTDDGVEIAINADIQDNRRQWSQGGFHITSSPAGARLESDYLTEGIVNVDAELDIASNRRASGGIVLPARSEETLKPNEFWSAGLPIPGTGSYVMEWKIPLTAMDTGTGDGEPVAPATGDVMLFNTVVNDNDRQGAGGQSTHALLWLVEDDPKGPWSGAERTWAVPIELTGKADFGDPSDINGDGEFTAADIDAVAAAVRDGSQDFKFDVDQNGTVEFADHRELIKSLRRTWIGDSNLDGEFSTRDLVAVFETGLYETGEPAGWAGGDWNGDGLFGTTDLVNAFQDGGFELGPVPDEELAAVPEPQFSWITLMLLLMTIKFAARRSAN